MKINSEDTIWGHEILKVRNLFRKLKNQRFVKDRVIDLLDISKRQCIKLLDELEQKKLIKEVNSPSNQQLWELTLKGNQLALASAAKPIKRETADKRFNEFMDRVNEVNNNSYYLYKVVKVILFGSYLTDKERINDVDIAIKLIPKIDDHGIFRELSEARAQKARQEGRQFSNIVDEIYWARTEVVLFLKSRARSLSIHSTGDAILEEPNIEKKMILDNE